MRKIINLLASNLIAALLFFTLLPGTAHAQTASLKWPSDYLGGNVYSSPAVGPDGYIYVASFNGGIYKINPVSGAAQQITNIGGNVYSSPAIAPDGTMYVGSLYGRIHAINHDGSQKWVFSYGGSYYSSPAIGTDGTVYAANYSSRTLHALNPEDGSVKWVFTAAAGLYHSSPAIGPDGTIYVGSWGPGLYAINPDGKQKWLFSPAGYVYSSPAIDADGTVYVASYNTYNFFAVNPDGTMKWYYNTGGYMYSSPVIGPDGMIYMGVYNRGLMAITPRGSLSWFFTGYSATGIQEAAPAVAADGTVYVGTNSGYILAINPDNTLKWYYTTGANIKSSPAIDADGTVYIPAYNGRLYALAGAPGGPADSPWPMYRNNSARTGAPQPECPPGYYDPDCSQCPGGAETPCSGHGTCDDGFTGTGICTCEPGYVGTECQLEPWAATYGGADYEELVSVSQTADGGYIAAGRTASFGAGGGDMLVIRLDESGAVAWQKTCGGTEFDYAFSAQQTADGGFIVGGATMSAGVAYHDIWLLKLDAAGSIQWQKTYGGASSENAYTVQQTTDGGYVVGARFDGGALSVIRLDASGTVVWQQSGGFLIDSYNCIQQTADGGFIAVGSKSSNSTDILLVKLDAAGSVSWQKVYYSAGSNNQVHAIRQAPDGGYIMATSASTASGIDFLAVKLDASGAISWQKSFGGAGMDLVHAVQPTADGGYVLAGETNSFGAGSNDILVIKLDGTGNIQWQQTYGGSDYEYPRSIQQTTDGGYVIGATTRSFGAGGGDFFVLRLDGNGDEGLCYLSGTAAAAVTGGATSVLGDTVSISTPSCTVGDTAFTSPAGSAATGIVCPGCAPGYYGSDCLSECPGGAAAPCGNHGTCDDDIDGTGVCTCDAGFTGEACDGFTADCQGACAHTRATCDAACFVEWNGEGREYESCIAECLASYTACLDGCLVSDAPIFWNSLGSAGELQNSIIGPDLITEGLIGFKDGVFGNAFYSTGGWYCTNRILTPVDGLQLDPQQGTVEAWVKYPLSPIVQAYNYSMFSIIDGPYQKGTGRDPLIGDQVIGYIGDGTSGTLFTYYVEVNFGSPVQITVPGIDAIFGDNAFHHVAIVWDKDGIGGTGDTIRLYIDNEIIGSSEDSSWGSVPDAGTHHSIGKGENIPSQSDPNIAAFIIDEVKVWNQPRAAFVLDADADGVADVNDNCPVTPNGPAAGTCLSGDRAGELCNYCTPACLRTRKTCEAQCEADYNGPGVPEYDDCMTGCADAYAACTAACADDCGAGGTCSSNQDDADGDGIGDACYQSAAITAEETVDSFTVDDQTVSLINYEITITNNGVPVPGAQVYLTVEVAEEDLSASPSIQRLVPRRVKAKTASTSSHKIVSHPADANGKAKLCFFNSGCSFKDASKKYTFTYSKHGFCRWFPRPDFGCCEVYVSACSRYFCFTTTSAFCSLKNLLLSFLNLGSTFWTEEGTCNASTGRCGTPTLIELAAFTATADRKSVVLAWKTDSEIDNAGFNIYRSDRPDGGYRIINGRTIPAQGFADMGADYTFTDTAVRSGKTYYYRLEDINLNGTTTMHGPVSATPRLLHGLC